MLNKIYTNDDIQRYAPSVFATEASSTRSEKYVFIPTIQIVEAMRSNGWNVVKAQQSRTKIEANKGYTKHMVRFAPVSQAMVVGDSRIEVVLINSHNGSSQYSLMAGVFRLVCMNGMVVADSLLEAIKVRHQGNIIDMVLEGSKRILDNAPIVNETIQNWKEITLSQPEQRILAEEAHSIRFPEGSVIRPEQLLNPRRRDDNGNDLWSTFNRLQESTIRGGNRNYDPNANGGRGRNVRSREVKDITGNVNLNKALWSLAEKMAALKNAA